MSDPLDEADLADLCEMTKSLHISTKGLNVEEIKAKLRDYLETSATRRDTEVSTLMVSGSLQRTCMYGCVKYNTILIHASA